MKNTLVDNQNNMFIVTETMIDEDMFDLDKVSDAVFERRIKASLVAIESAKVIVAGGALIGKLCEDVYGIPPHPSLPLIPPSMAEEPVLVSKKRNSLLKIPKAK